MAPITPDALAAPRRAGLLMFVIGGLTLLVGTCLLAVIISTPAPLLGQQMQQSATATGQSVPFSADELKIVISIFMAITVLIAIGFLVLGAGVRRGGKASTITAIVITSLVLAFFGIEMIGMLVMAMRAPANLAVACMMVIPVSLLGLLAVWLISALKATAKAASMQQLYAAQYWQYQQNMQAYAYAQQQQGYLPQGYLPQGYATAPPPPPVPPPPPAPPAADSDEAGVSR